MSNTFEIYDINPGGQQATNTPPDGAPEGQQAGTLNDCIRQNWAYERRSWGDISGEDGGGNDRISGGANSAYTLTITNNFSAYHPGMHLTFKANHASTGASTLTVTTPSGALTSVDLVQADGTPTAAGTISADQWVTAKYDAVAGRFALVSVVPVSADQIPGSQAVTATTYQIVDPDDYNKLFVLAGTTGPATLQTQTTPSDGFTFRVIATDLTNTCTVTLTDGQQVALESEGTKISANYAIENLYQTFTLRWDASDNIWTVQAGGRIAANRLYDLSGEIRGAMRPFVETSGTTLQDSDMGKVFKLTGTVTLPDISATKIPLNASIRLVANGGTLTANTTGGQTIDWSKASGATSLVLADRESITLRKESASVWGVDSIDAPSVTGGAGGWEFITTQTFSTNQNFVEITGLDDYAEVYLEFEAVAASQAARTMRVGDGTGISPGNISYAGEYGRFAANNRTNSPATYWNYSTGSGSQEYPNVGQSFYGNLRFFGVGTTRMSFSGESGYLGNGCFSKGIIPVVSATYGALNRIRLESAGITPYISSGTYTWYGLRRGT